MAINELVRGVACAQDPAEIYLGGCNEYREPVTIDQLIRAVSFALNGCPE